MRERIDNRPKCGHCNEAPADVIEYDYLLSCATCWNEKNIPKGWKLRHDTHHSHSQSSRGS